MVRALLVYLYGCQIPDLLMYSPDPRLIKQLQIVDTPAEREFDELVQLASYICGTPTSLVTFLEPNRQFHKARVGFELTEIPLSQSFCQYACASGKQAMVVEDATKDSRFANNPLVTEDGVRFYAGVPIAGEDPDVPLGALCVLDKEARTLDEGQRSALKALANQAEQLLKQRVAAKKLEEKTQRLQQLNAELQEYSSVIAHDLKSPLTNLSMVVELLENSPGLDSLLNAPRFVHMMKASIQSQASMIDGLLEVRKNASFLEEPATTFSTHRIMDELLDAMPIEKMRVNITCKELFVYSRKTAVKQVLRNLLTNALKYSPLHMDVEVSFFKEEDSFGFFVQDFGPGIDPEHQKTIFKLFTTLKHKDHQGNTGTGLGLSIVKRIVDGLGGEIELASELGKGCRFTVTLEEVLYD